MKAAYQVFSLSLLLIFLVIEKPVGIAQSIKTPKEYFGFEPGSDRKLFDYQRLIDYLNHLDSGSDRLQMHKVGKSPMGKDMYVMFLSSEQNIADLENLRQINKKLALDPVLSNSEREKLIQKGRVFVMASMSMHSGEVGPSQMLPLYAYRLVTAGDERSIQQLANVVWMIVPNHNPDGMDMIVNHYRKYLDTKYEGCSMPGVYHKYVGHDNNRDFVALTQSDTRVVSKLFSTQWYPQVLVQKHQMGTTSPRYFVPPYHDPISENTDHGLIEWCSVFGANLLKDMGEKGLKGVATHWMFDNYWPGSTETSTWKNVISLLTEAASVKIAKPLFIEPTELTVYGKGLAEYKKSVNMPDPWPGGWWRLSDIVAYEIASMDSLAQTAASYRTEILRFRNDLCRRETNRGYTEAPFYYLMPQKQHDRSEFVRLVRLLQEHGIEVYRLKEQIVLDARSFEAEDVVVPLRQPYRAFIKEVMERQVYPVRHYTPQGKIILPYDITSWSLPLHMGVTAVEIMTRYEDLESRIEKLNTIYQYPGKKTAEPSKARAMVFSARDNASYRAAFIALKGKLSVSRLTQPWQHAGHTMPKGSFVVESAPGKENLMNQIYRDIEVAPLLLEEKLNLSSRDVQLPKIGLVETYMHDMDAGWTRWVFDDYKIPYKVLRPGEFEKINLRGNYDVIVFPSASKEILLKGVLEKEEHYYPIDYPPEYKKGLGEKGLAKLMAFVDAGGRVVSWAGSTELFLGDLKLDAGKKVKSEHAFRLPVRDISKDLKKNGLRVPGSMLRAELLTDHPLAWGMGEQIGVFSRGRPVLKTSVPTLDMDRRVIAHFPENDILLSGYIEKPKLLSRNPAMIWIGKGKGQMVLFGFYPQYRGSTPATYKLLFNALFL